MREKFTNEKSGGKHWEYIWSSELSYRGEFWRDFKGVLMLGKRAVRSYQFPSWFWSQLWVGCKSFTYIPILFLSEYSSIMLGRNRQKYQTQIWVKRNSQTLCLEKYLQQMRKLFLSWCCQHFDAPRGEEQQS